MYTAFIVAGLATFPASDLRAPVSITVDLEVKQIAVGDPLLVKTVVNNTSQRVLSFEPPLSVVGGNLIFAVKGPNDADFFTLPLQAVSWPYAPARSFDAAVEFASYDYLFRYEERRRKMVDVTTIFSRAGTWYIRATVAVESTTFHSEPVAIKVIERTDRSGAALDGCAKSFAFLLAHPIRPPTPEELEMLAKAEPELAGTNAAAAIQRMQLLGELHYAKSAEQREKCEVRLAEYTQKLGVVQKEYTELIRGIVFLKRKEYPQLRKHLKGISASSSIRGNLYGSLHMLDPQR